MSLQQLDSDEWEGVLCKELKVPNPTWDEVEAAIRRLDANRYTIACLVAPDQRHLLIGGGTGQFVMTVGLDEDRHLTAQDENKPSGEVELTVGGQTGNYDNRTIWDMITVLKCARLFWQDNELHPSVTWV